MKGAYAFLLWGCFSLSCRVVSFCKVALTCHCCIPACKIRLAVCATLFNSSVVLHIKSPVGSRIAFPQTEFCPLNDYSFFSMYTNTAIPLPHFPCSFSFVVITGKSNKTKNEATLMARDPCEQMAGSYPELYTVLLQQNSYVKGCGETSIYSAYGS